MPDKILMPAQRNNGRRSFKAARSIPGSSPGRIPLGCARMRALRLVLGLGRVIMVNLMLAVPAEADTVRVWTTTLDLRQRLAEGASLSTALLPPGTEPTIVVRPEIVFQSMLGLGASLEHSTWSNLW